MSWEGFDSLRESRIMRLNYLLGAIRIYKYFQIETLLLLIKLASIRVRMEVIIAHQFSRETALNREILRKSLKFIRGWT